MLQENAEDLKDSRDESLESVRLEIDRDFFGDTNHLLEVFFDIFQAWCVINHHRILEVVGQRPEIEVDRANRGDLIIDEHAFLMVEARGVCIDMDARFKIEVELALSHPVDDLLIRDARDNEIDFNATLGRTLKRSNKRIGANEVRGRDINPLSCSVKHVDVILLANLLIVVIWPRGVAKEEDASFVFEVRIVITFGEKGIIGYLMGA